MQAHRQPTFLAKTKRAFHSGYALHGNRAVERRDDGTAALARLRCLDRRPGRSGRSRVVASPARLRRRPRRRRGARRAPCRRQDRASRVLAGGHQNPGRPHRGQAAGPLGHRPPRRTGRLLLSDAEIETRIPEALHRFETCAPTDRRRQAAERQLLGKPGRHRRAAYANAVRFGYEIKDIEHHRVRQFRNILYGATAVLTAVVILLCVVGATFPTLYPSASRPRPRPRRPRPRR